LVGDGEYVVPATKPSPLAVLRHAVVPPFVKALAPGVRGRRKLRRVGVAYRHYQSLHIRGFSLTNHSASPECRDIGHLVLGPLQLDWPHRVGDLSVWNFWFGGVKEPQARLLPKLAQ